MNLSIKYLFVTLSINEYSTMYGLAECRCAECLVLLMVLLNGFILSVIMLNVINLTFEF
jgi:hypothetical protein